MLRTRTWIVDRRPEDDEQFSRKANRPSSWTRRGWGGSVSVPTPRASRRSRREARRPWPRVGEWDRGEEDQQTAVGSLFRENWIGFESRTVIRQLRCHLRCSPNDRALTRCSANRMRRAAWKQTSCVFTRATMIIAQRARRRWPGRAQSPDDARPRRWASQWPRNHPVEGCGIDHHRIGRAIERSRARAV